MQQVHFFTTNNFTGLNVNSIHSIGSERFFLDIYILHTPYLTCEGGKIGRLEVAERKFSIYI
jgi:hypothetical protein